MRGITLFIQLNKPLFGAAPPHPTGWRLQQTRKDREPAGPCRRWALVHWGWECARQFGGPQKLTGHSAPGCLPPKPNARSGGEACMPELGGEPLFAGAAGRASAVHRDDVHMHSGTLLSVYREGGSAECCPWVTRTALSEGSPSQKDGCCASPPTLPLCSRGAGAQACPVRPGLCSAGAACRVQTLAHGTRPLLAPIVAADRGPACSSAVVFPCLASAPDPSLSWLPTFSACVPLGSPAPGQCFPQLAVVTLWLLGILVSSPCYLSGQA